MRAPRSRSIMRRAILCVLAIVFAREALAGGLDQAFLRGSDVYEPDRFGGTAYTRDVAAAAPAEMSPWSVGTPEFQVEIGARYWHSSRGAFAKDLYDDPRFSNNLNS